MTAAAVTHYFAPASEKKTDEPRKYSARWVGKPGQMPKGKVYSHPTESPMAKATLVSYKPGGQDVRMGFKTRGEMLVAMHHAGIGFFRERGVPNAVRKHMMRERLSRRERRKSFGGGGGDVQVSSYTRESGPVSSYTRSRPS